MNKPLQSVPEEQLRALRQLARVCNIDIAWLLFHQREGLLGDITAITRPGLLSDRLRVRISRMHGLERDFEAVPELAALVADFLDELDVLRAHCRRAGGETTRITACPPAEADTLDEHSAATWRTTSRSAIRSPDMA